LSADFAGHLINEKVGGRFLQGRGKPLQEGSPPTKWMQAKK
jgi:hypothetical protein